MAGAQKRKERAALITKALLLGYTFEEDPIGGWNLVLPDGKTHRLIDDSLHGYGRRITTPNWPAMHLAAIEALKLSGVYDATKSQRDTGTGSGKNFRLRSQRHERARARRIAESSSPRSR